MRRLLLVPIALLLVPAVTACGGDDDDDADGASEEDDGGGEADDGDQPPADGECTEVDDATALVIGSAASDDDYALVLPAQALSESVWDQVDNEAVVLDVSSAERGVLGQLVLHQGQAEFPYGMALGRLAAGDEVSVVVSTLSAMNATRAACVGPATLTPAAELGDDADGLVNAPVFRWPLGKRFDDLPVLLGWSAARKDYQAVYITEDGGTVEQCGGGGDGIQAEIARWGRAADIEGVYSYGESPRWGRCTGSAEVADGSPRFEDGHPIFYYGDGHNRLFENRGGYGETCGGGGAEKSDGDLVGWNVDNPGNEAELDEGLVITVRPLPVALDPLGYDAFSGRREALQDAYAPWIYRLTFLELAREDKIDGERSFPMEQYLYVDVHVADVDGSGDRECAINVSEGFMVRAVTADGAKIEGPQMTASYAGDDEDWKRIAVPVPEGFSAADVDHFEFDAYDGDGVYLLGLGDAFLVRPEGPAGAVLEPVQEGVQELTYYVDDDSSGCTDGVNTDGPGGVPYTCVEDLVQVAPEGGTAPSD
jgi:hypothetical protein